MASLYVSILPDCLFVKCSFRKKDLEIADIKWNFKFVLYP